MYAGLLLTLALLSVSCQAWLPEHHRRISTRDGVNLFKRTDLREANSSGGNVYVDGLDDIVKLRGVNLGAYFIVEDWMASTVFSSFNCSKKSEFDCVTSLHDQTTANADFQSHWQSWINAQDFLNMRSYSLNTVRIPVGYWFLESIVDPSEHFPQGGEQYLDQAVQWAKDAGLYVILELHGAPGAQATDAFTGQLNPDPGFFSTYNYDRAYKWLVWITNKIHTNPAYSTVGMLGLLNEPVRIGDKRYPNASSQTTSMRSEYYPKAWNSIRQAEINLNISTDQRVHIQMMDQDWGSGNPDQFLSDLTFAAYDDHRYIKYTSVPVSHESYLNASCNDRRDSMPSTIVGEWSLSVPDNVQDTPAWTPKNSTNQDFYKKWFAAQVMAYEKGDTMGWTFWSWKTSGLNDPRWDYRMAVQSGIIPKSLDDVYDMSVCNQQSQPNTTVLAPVATASSATRPKSNLCGVLLGALIPFIIVVGKSLHVH